MITTLPDVSELIAQCPDLLITPNTQNIIVDLDHQNDCIVITHLSLDEAGDELDRTYIFVKQEDGSFVLDSDEERVFVADVADYSTSLLMHATEAGQ